MLGPWSMRLVSVASGSLGRPELARPFDGRVLGELSELLAERNGFYAFESALHVFASGDADAVGGSLEVWNAAEGWRADYRGLADGFVFFAEDVFGAQFAIREDRIYTFDPETAEAEVMASSIEDWADQLLASYEVLSGFPLARRWQQAHGSLVPGERLIPKVPFVLGGGFEPSNVYSLDASQGMRVRAELALQIRDLPDGAKVRYRIIE